MLSLISKLAIPFILGIPTALSTPILESRPLGARLLPDPNPNTCLPPLLLCGRACCGTGSICGLTGLCAPKPPPQPGQLWVTYTNDQKGRPCVINVHGQHFNTTAEIEIQTVVGNSIVNVWDGSHIATHSFSINTGVQDCSKTGGQVDAGFAAEVYAWDMAYVDYYEVMVHTSAIPVRVTTTGECP